MAALLFPTRLLNSGVKLMCGPGLSRGPIGEESGECGGGMNMPGKTGGGNGKGAGTGGIGGRGGCGDGGGGGTSPGKALDIPEKMSLSMGPAFIEF